jgi:hypothetical protein
MSNNEEVKQVNEVKPKGKGKKALNKLNGFNKELESIRIQLKIASNILHEMINQIGKSKDCDDMQSKTVEPNLNKRRSIVKDKDIPDRIEFEFMKLNFYIDFTVVTSSSDDLTDLKGSIIYGANRTLCFTNCIFPEKGKECENCERIDRCDRLEDKPLLQFTVNRHGLIKSAGELDDEWWIKENENEDLLDMHLRAIEFIWGKALDWTNENLLP